MLRLWQDHVKSFPDHGKVMGIKINYEGVNSVHSNFFLSEGRCGEISDLFPYSYCTFLFPSRSSCMLFSFIMTLTWV
jgi:hypothetical protein